MVYSCFSYINTIIQPWISHKAWSISFNKTVYYLVFGYDYNPYWGKLSTSLFQVGGMCISSMSFKKISPTDRDTDICIYIYTYRYIHVDDDRSTVCMNYIPEMPCKHEWIWFISSESTVPSRSRTSKILMRGLCMCQIMFGCTSSWSNKIKYIEI